MYQVSYLPRAAAEVAVRCRESDKAMVQQCLAGAAAEYYTIYNIQYTIYYILDTRY